MRRYLFILLFTMTFVLHGQWNYDINLYHAQRNKTARVRVWYATDSIRAFLLSGSIGNSYTFCTNSTLRNYLQTHNMGILYIQTQQFSMSIFQPSLDSVFFNFVLDTMAKLTGKPEYRYGHWVVFGHSTDGLFCQNLSLWKPQRTLGILYYKSGNLGNTANMRDTFKSIAPLKNIPFLAINGRYEEYGPDGPFPGCTSPYPPECYRQVQWLAMRDTLIKLRKRDFLAGMIVDYYGSANHTSWSNESGEFMARFAVAAANAQLPGVYPRRGVVSITRPLEKNGWLADSSVSFLIDQVSLHCFPVEAHYSLFPAAKEDISFWLPPGQTVAEEWVKFHHPSYSVPLSPVSLVAAGGSLSVSLTWTDRATNEINYYIQRTTDTTDGFITIDTIPANSVSYLNTGLTNDSIYFYRVFAATADGYSGFSNVSGASVVTAVLPSDNHTPEISVIQSEDYITIISRSAIIESVALVDLGGRVVVSSQPFSNTCTLSKLAIIRGLYLVLIHTVNGAHRYKLMIG